MLRIIAERIKPHVKRIVAEEQAGFLDGRSTVEQICNVRILGEKLRDHQQELHQNFIVLNEKTQHQLTLDIIN